MLTIHAAGNWSRQQVHTTFAESSRTSNEEVEVLIEAAWQKTLARPDVHLFDGPMCRLERWSADNDRLELVLSQTSYKVFLGTNLANAGLFDRLGPGVMANPVGLSPALLTGDGRLVMGRRNSKVAYYPDRVHPFAGALEPKDGADVFAGIIRELGEELRLSQGEIVSISCIGLAEDRSLHQPELFFAAETALTERQLVDSLDAEEHRSVWSIPATQTGVEDALTDLGRLTPVAAASLLLWGKLRFGNRWFTQASAPLVRA
jgi:hypothetical protein